MEENILIFIQDQIGYNFKNTDLLEQAFTRRSYSQEAGGEDNEVLEFIGDKALDIVVVKYLSETYGYFSHDCDDFDPQNDYDEFICEYNESKLTEIKQSLVSKKNLARCIDMLGLQDFLIMGNSDIRNKVQRQDSVKEDLFEAIVGAVALDSAWDFDAIQSVVRIMLNESMESFSEEMNYIELIQEWNLKKNNKIPFYHYKKQSYTSSIYFPFDGISYSEKYLGSMDVFELQYSCLMKLSDTLPIFRGFGKSKAEARHCVCEVAYNYLENHNLLFTIKDEIENPNQRDAINQLETLARRGYFSLPRYDFTEEHDLDGNPIWHCVCCIAEFAWKTTGESSKKTDSKRIAAFSALMRVLKGHEFA